MAKPPGAPVAIWMRPDVSGSALVLFRALVVLFCRMLSGTVVSRLAQVLPNVEWHGRLNIGASSMPAVPTSQKYGS